jgi:membrane protease subunit HflK
MTKVNVSSVRSLENRGQMLTQDENIVDLNYSVQYRVNDAQDFLFRVRDPELTLREAVESALRESVGTNGLDFILSGAGREVVGNETGRVLQETMDRYESGIQVTKFNLESSTAPQQVLAAFEDVNKAREDRERFVEEAQVHANSVIPEARGAAARIIQEAEGYRDSTIALATGEAERFSLLREEYSKAPEVTRKRMYLQTMENVLARSRKVLIDVDASGNVLYLPLDQLGGGSSSAMAPIVTPENSAQQPADRGSSSRTTNREGRR